MVEHLLPKQRVAGSIPVSRSRYDFYWGAAQGFAVGDPWGDSRLPLQTKLS